MRVEELDEAQARVAVGGGPAGASAGGSATPRRAEWQPPVWLLVGLAAAYLAALAALAFLPGDTLLQRLTALDAGICAQNPTHSFFPAGQQLPLCSRNTGIYIGFATTFLMLLALGRLRASSFPGRWVAAILGLAVLAMAVDGFNSLFFDLGLPHPYPPHNLLRLATGLGTGVAVCAFIVPVANSLIWRDEDERSSFATPGALAVMLPALLLVFLAVGGSPQVAPLLYPIALLSTAGLVIALSLVNLAFVLGAANRVGRIATWRQFFPVYTIGLILALAELVALSALKTSLLHALQPV
jgi:uncharacterized membrane protein